MPANAVKDGVSVSDAKIGNYFRTSVKEEGDSLTATFQGHKIRGTKSN